MEFKGYRDRGAAGGSGVLIESDWNLKTLDDVAGYLGKSVLIESDWNLKEESPSRSSLHLPVLIESDWNLKPHRQLLTMPRRNSY